MTALMLLFAKNAIKLEFDSRGFKLLWAKEKSIDKKMLKEYMHKNSAQKLKLVAAVPEAAVYFK